MSNFKVHIEPSYWSEHSSNERAYLTSSSIEINEGFKPNTSAHSAAVNAILHETSLFVVAMNEFLKDTLHGNASATVTPDSSVNDVRDSFMSKLTNFINASIAKQVGNNLTVTLNNSAKTYNGSAAVALGNVFAPTAATGTNKNYSGQILLSVANNGAPIWSNTNKGSATKPLHIDSNGVLSECDDYAGGTAITLNTTSKAAQAASFFAPTSTDLLNDGINADKTIFIDGYVPYFAKAPIAHALIDSSWAATKRLCHAIDASGNYVTNASNKYAHKVDGITIDNNVIQAYHYVSATTAAAGNSSAFVWSFWNFANGSGNKMSLTKAANGAVTLDVAGAITGNNITGQNYYSTSDMRLKDHVIDFKPQKSVLDLPIKQFDMKSDGSHHIGCIAQDLQEICPEIVHENTAGYLEIEESKLVYLLINEVKELKKEIESLKGEK